jgi:hypothetical protein
MGRRRWERGSKSKREQLGEKDCSSSKKAAEEDEEEVCCRNERKEEGGAQYDNNEITTMHGPAASQPAFLLPPTFASSRYCPIWRKEAGHHVDVTVVIIKGAAIQFSSSSSS